MTTINSWLPVITALVMMSLATAAEGIYTGVRSKQGIMLGLSYALASNLIAFAIGGIVSFIVFGVLLALAWGGGLESVPGGETTIWAAVIFGLFFPVIFLLFIKRSTLGAFRLLSGLEAWGHASAWAVISALLTFLPAIMVGYYNIKI